MSLRTPEQPVFCCQGKCCVAFTFVCRQEEPQFFAEPRNRRREKSAADLRFDGRARTKDDGPDLWYLYLRGALRTLGEADWPRCGWVVGRVEESRKLRRAAWAVHTPVRRVGFWDCNRALSSHGNSRNASASAGHVHMAGCGATALGAVLRLAGHMSHILQHVQLPVERVPCRGNGRCVARGAQEAL